MEPPPAVRAEEQEQEEDEEHQRDVGWEQQEGEEEEEGGEWEEWQEGEGGGDAEEDVEEDRQLARCLFCAFTVRRSSGRSCSELQLLGHLLRLSSRSLRLTRRICRGSGQTRRIKGKQQKQGSSLSGCLRVHRAHQSEAVVN